MFRLTLATGWTWEYVNSLPVSLLREFMAFDRFIEPFGREWQQSGMLAAAMIAPHVRGKPPRPDEFMPIQRLSMTADEIAAELAKLRVDRDA